STTSQLVSFSWDNKVPSRTVCEYNLSQLTWPGTPQERAEWVRGWASAFDVEKVTVEFYRGRNGYHDVFKGFEEKLKGTFVRDQVAEQKRLFTQQLFNRL